jgi:CheY-like chemotaxis protein
MNKKSTLRTHNVKALVVDDNDINLKVVKELLNSLDVQVVLAQSGEECLAILEAEADFDIILLDYRMPHMDGIQTIRGIKKLLGELIQMLPIVALTAEETPRGKEEFIVEGFCDVMSKPIGNTELENIIYKYIKSSKIEAICENTDEFEICNLKIDGVDTSLGFKYSNCSMECYLDILKCVCEEITCQENLLQEFYAKRDFKGYAIQVHGLKGVASSIGAIEFASIARLHESAAKKEDVDYIDANFVQLLNDYNGLVNSIKKAL